MFIDRTHSNVLSIPTTQPVTASLHHNNYNNQTKLPTRSKKVKQMAKYIKRCGKEKNTNKVLFKEHELANGLEKTL